MGRLVTTGLSRSGDSDARRWPLKVCSGSHQIHLTTEYREKFCVPATCASKMAEAQDRVGHSQVTGRAALKPGDTRHGVALTAAKMVPKYTKPQTTMELVTTYSQEYRRPQAEEGRLAHRGRATRQDVIPSCTGRCKWVGSSSRMSLTSKPHQRPPTHLCLNISKTDHPPSGQLSQRSSVSKTPASPEAKEDRCLVSSEPPSVTRRDVPLEGLTTYTADYRWANVGRSETPPSQLRVTRRTSSSSMCAHTVEAPPVVSLQRVVVTHHVHHEVCLTLHTLTSVCELRRVVWGKEDWDPQSPSKELTEVTVLLQQVTVVQRDGHRRSRASATVSHPSQTLDSGGPAY
ncbi:uncharacterized protein LOC114654994 [Erpetoichthys calabaricus]|uniref:uncharacterized protein LOC114654994 n=1 Tax=Erpetoichthys calabaricus TaxID=27687 RepID=UPI00109F14A2|nr:uncharacterized protein LOC114654994 [Erpetoichthys calabaricus]